MTATSPTSPTLAVAGAAVTNIGGTASTVAWSTPTNVYSSNNAYATVTLGDGATSHYLYASNFGFTIPTNAIITGVTVSIERKADTATKIVDNSIRLARRGIVVGAEKANYYNTDVTASVFYWPASDTANSYGSSTDLWGLPWMPADLNNFQFGVMVSARNLAGSGGSYTASIDHITVTVDYTSGYLSGAQVQEAGEVFLFGQRYKLAKEKNGAPGTVKVSLGTQFSPKIDTGGPFGRPTNPVIETYEVSDLRGGMGLYRYQDYPKDGKRFWTSQNMDTLWANAVTLAPLTTTLGSSTGGSNLNFVAYFNNTLVAISTTKVLTHSTGLTGGSWTLRDTLPGNVRDVAVIDNASITAIVYATSTGYSYQTDLTVAATDVTASATAPDAISLAVWDEKVWAVDEDLKIWSTSDLVTWDATLARIPIEPRSRGTLVVYDDASGDPILYCITVQGAWIYDVTNDKWFPTRFQYPVNLWDGNVGRGGGVVYRGKLYLGATNQLKLMEYNVVGGGAEVNNVSPSHPDGIPAVLGTSLSALTADNELLFAQLTGASSTANTILVFNGIGWHCIHYLAGTNQAIGSLGVIAAASFYNLYFGIADTTNDSLSYLSIAALSTSPLISTTRTYATSGYVELPIFDAVYPSQPKIVQQVRIKLLGAGTTETVQVAYRTNGSTGSYTNLGSAVTVNSEVVLPFGTNNVGLEFNSIQFRLTFASAGSTAAPKMEYFAMDFLRQPEVLRAFVVDIDVNDFSFNRTPQMQIDALWAHMKATTFGTFAYHNDSGDERSYLVKVLSPTGNEDTGYQSGGVYSLRLLEVGPN